MKFLKYISDGKMTALRHLILTVALLLGFSFNLAAQQVLDEVAELKGINVVEHLGDTINLDLTFTNELGQQVKLGSYFNQGKPVILLLGYYECPMLCNLVFNGVTESIRELDWMPGGNYQMVTVSIDPLETTTLAQAKKKNYLTSLKMDENSSGWAFLTGEQSQSEALAKMVGFEYYYDKDRDEYAHPAVVFILGPDGKISRYLYGLEYKPADLKLALLEASQGKIGNTVDKIILYCFHYDPDAKGYVVFAGNVMRLGGAVVLVLMTILLTSLWLRERRKRVKKVVIGPTGISL